MKLFNHLTLFMVVTLSFCGNLFAATDKPNILFIMGDDIGIMNVGAYHRGLMVGETPNIAAPPGARRSLPACIRCARVCFSRSCRARPVPCCREHRRSASFCTISATRRASSARITSAT